MVTKKTTKTTKIPKKIAKISNPKTKKAVKETVVKKAVKDVKKARSTSSRSSLSGRAHPSESKTVQAAPKKKAVKEEQKPRLRIRMKAYEYKILDASLKQIIDTAERFDALIVGPVPLPTEIKKYTVNRSPFIFKDSREQFEIRVHQRLIDILDPSPRIVEALTNLSLPSGVGIDIRMI